MQPTFGVEYLRNVCHCIFKIMWHFGGSITIHAVYCFDCRLPRFPWHPHRQNPTELLAYYRDRIALFNQERHEYAQKLEDCAVSREEYYKLRWELNQRDTEIAELQKALRHARE